MFLSDGLYLPTHRPLPKSQLEQARLAANSNRRRPVGLLAPFTATWWLLVVGALLAAAAIAAQLS
ncbi:MULTISPECIES: hypothetical protein [Mesorhizobium]|jgi:hypothetical protein|uniref:Uncharacterized protein n=1 Tax=Rhizobium loti TaxID=381 RepID=A0A8E2WAJ6_RHILI|nr:MULTISPECIES: hypothetical protein [Mesorhizobium]AZO40782.1 hypothetical protein EJ076_06375 [Mesorhizobium sp. M7D.F.Ca.US.005.01.1.1]PWJ90158.1 hypothetical protein C8D77_10549 [Mesorhizobium loti]RUX91400.1 hypothetical protein EN993_27175 [Mesorhizobium sp. M7D.F.Ca.US.004.01.2.1]RVA27688.1 hypothetical protein EN935_19915 [Mesorhizobium sp. M7D.F.Ca.US.004.03.1.1]